MPRLIRPDIKRALIRYRELIALAGVALFGLWLVWLGGYILAPLGIVAIAAAVALAVAAWRRLGFRPEVSAQGVVEVVEGRVSYYGPNAGASIDLSDIAEVQALMVQGMRCWRIRQTDGQALLVPLAAAGAESLYDALIALPGMDARRLSRVPGEPLAERVVLWRRSDHTLTNRIGRDT
ncbi:hypothetical protein RM543_02735 [Roseicyclus sp. F158]|uniref:PH domain-containing protein n=1 Tax=Tropicimonas omnivorans TaxID=3075590 RepID=A0ABU3DD03_9RHOB|nr:hypothetical protein [Roseicyclus sp. F158]MDT0681588.1 hypothetical protein [Roseicyclus sp. F158]